MNVIFVAFGRQFIEIIMKNIILSLAMLAALLTGCQKTEFNNTDESDSFFTASIEESGAQTKTNMTYRRQVTWSAEDRIAIFQGKQFANQYQLRNEYAGSSNGTFKLVAKNTSSSAVADIPCNVALYPYSENIVLSRKMDNDKGTAYNISNVVLPQTQMFSYDSFGNGAFPMVAVTKDLGDHNLKFKNVMGAIQFEFVGNQSVKSINIKGNNGERLAGEATITANGNNLTPTIQMGSEAFTEVTLDCGYGVQLMMREPTKFIIALPPVKFTKGFTVTIKFQNGDEHVISTDKENEILRSSLCTMPPQSVLDDDSQTPYSSLCIVGSYNGWMIGDGYNQYIGDFKGDDILYSGLIDFGKNHSYNEFKITGEAWGLDEYSMRNHHAPETKTISLIEGGGDNINVYQEKRYYQLVLDRSKCTLTSNISFNQLGIIGDFNYWSEDVVMDFNPYTQKFYTDIEFEADVYLKLRFDSDWALQLGSRDGSLEFNADDIHAPAGKYRIYVNLNNPEKMTYIFDAKAYGTEEDYGNFASNGSYSY